MLLLYLNTFHIFFPYLSSVNIISNIPNIDNRFNLNTLNPLELK
nr:MAG TPA: hypothetical protein [Caudoviricetes sp.]